MCSVNSCFFQTTNASLYHDTIVACWPDCKNWYSLRTNCALLLRLFFLGCCLDFFGFVGFTLLPFAPPWLGAGGGTGRAEVGASTCGGWSFSRAVVGLVFFSPVPSQFFLFIRVCCVGDDACGKGQHKCRRCLTCAEECGVCFWVGDRFKRADRCCPAGTAAIFLEPKTVTWKLVGTNCVRRLSGSSPPLSS